MTDLWTVEEHLADILGTVRPLDPIELPLLDADGCVLTDDVLVPAPLPPFDNSSMDGYAVRTADVEGAGDEFPAVLTVIGDIAAGRGDPPAVGPGQAARIMTGAPLPPGAQTVVPVEWTDGGLGGGRADAMTPAATGEVRVYRPAPAGRHIRRRGSDAAAGTVALAAGTVLGPPQLGLLAATGHATVTVRPRPRVVVLSTGSELVAPGTPLPPGASTTRTATSSPPPRATPAPSPTGHAPSPTTRCRCAPPWRTNWRAPTPSSRAAASASGRTTS